jgi:hypothetical protein
VGVVDVDADVDVSIVADIVADAEVIVADAVFANADAATNLSAVDLILVLELVESKEYPDTGIVNVPSRSDGAGAVNLSKLRILQQLKSWVVFQNQNKDVSLCSASLIAFIFFIRRGVPRLW